MTETQQQKHKDRNGTATTDHIFNVNDSLTFCDDLHCIKDKRTN